MEHKHHWEPEAAEGGEMNPYVPFTFGPRLPNYYGDQIRMIFFGCGALALVITPLIGSEFPAILPFEIVGGIVFVILGALVSPTSKVSILSTVIAAAFGALFYELLALSLFNIGDYLAFIVREAIAVALLGALYFSVKTLRNMASGRVGRRDAGTSRDFYRPGDWRSRQPGDGD